MSETHVFAWVFTHTHEYVRFCMHSHLIPFFFLFCFLFFAFYFSLSFVFFHTMRHLSLRIGLVTIWRPGITPVTFDCALICCSQYTFCPLSFEGHRCLSYAFACFCSWRACAERRHTPIPSFAITNKQHKTSQKPNK